MAIDKRVTKYLEKTKTCPVSYFGSGRCNDQNGRGELDNLDEDHNCG